MPSVPDPIKAGLASLGSGGVSMAASVPTGWAIVLGIVVSGPLWLRAWNNEIAHVLDTWKPRDDGYPRVMLPRQPPQALPSAQMSKPAVVEGEQARKAA